jgi:hypothetical protein
VPSRAGFGKTGRVNATRRDPEFEQTEVYAGEDIEAADKAFAKIQEDICGPTHKLIPDGLGVRERKDGSTCKGYLCAFKNRVNGGCGWRMRRLVDNEGVIKIQSSRPAAPELFFFLSFFLPAPQLANLLLRLRSRWTLQSSFCTLEPNTILHAVLDSALLSCASTCTHARGHLLNEVCARTHVRLSARARACARTELALGSCETDLLHRCEIRTSARLRTLGRGALHLAGRKSSRNAAQDRKHRVVARGPTAPSLAQDLRFRKSWCANRKSSPSNS